MSETVIIGGGVIGLTTAYELAKLGQSVTVIDRQVTGKEASWAGAGMLPPGQCSGPLAVRELARLSSNRWPILSQELLTRTGIDNGYRQCGAIQISLAENSKLSEDLQAWREQGIACSELDAAGLQHRERHINSSFETGYLLPTMSQVRNPRHLKSLKEASLALGVRMIEGCEIREWIVSDASIRAVRSETEEFEATNFVLSGGAWSGLLAAQLGVSLEIVPVRGQIVLLKLPQPIITHIIEDGPRYLVPREDGYLLIGSTEEQVGYVKENTPQGVQGLIDFALQVVPDLAQAEVVKTWSGLRPCAVRGYPYIGPVDQYENLILATGHFRDGLSQSPATAQLVCNLIANQPLDFDTTAIGIKS